MKSPTHIYFKIIFTLDTNILSFNALVVCRRERKEEKRRVVKDIGVFEDILGSF